MDRKEKMRLLRALTKADNAFHKSLRESGYEVSYSIYDGRTGSIYDMSKPTWDRWPLGELTIKWSLRREKSE